MVVKIISLVAVLLGGANAASACISGPEATHNRELALIYTTLKKVTLTPDDLAAVKRLQAQAEQQHRARKFEQAQKSRSAALTKIGFRYEPAKPSVSPPLPPGQAVPPHANAAPFPPAKSTSAKQSTTRGCGDGGAWVLPPNS